VTSLPTGTVAFLMSDIEGSTRLATAAGARFPELLDAHFAVMRGAIEERGGTIVSTEGDSVFAVLPTARAAVAAAVAGQVGLAHTEWPPDLAVSVRIGIHVGEAMFGGRDYTGVDVHRAARIMAAAWGGQVIVSQAVAGLAGDNLDDGATLRDLGAHTLRDFPEPERLYQVVAAGLRADFPPPRTESAAARTNLPTPLTRFVGRARELAEVERLIADARLVTLTGPGGTGKTRLAIEVGRASLPAFSDGVFFVALDALRDPDLVVPQIAQTLGLTEDARRPIADVLAAYLAGKRVLLILDNLEQVISVAPRIGDIVSGAPSVAILGSSREPLGVAGETVYQVPALSLPTEPGHPSAAQLAGLESVELFVERARAARPEFNLTDDNAPAVAAICRRVDGLPLAIELAAARVNVLTPAQILDRLDHRLTLLAGSRRDVTDRQRTLRGAIDWSHDLLSDDEKAGFRRFAVFAGGADLEAALAVLDPDGSLATDPIDLLGALVGRSLLRSTTDEGQARFVMLETIREYALEQLVESGERPTICDRHADHYAAVATAARHVLSAPDRRERLDRLDADMPNFREAIEWSIASGNAARGESFALGLKDFWRTRNHLIEARRLIDAIVASLPTEAVRERAYVIGVGAELASWNTDYETSRRMGDEQLALLESIGDKAGLAQAYDVKGWSHIAQQPDLARTDFERTIEFARDAGDTANEFAGMQGLALALLRLGDLEESRRVSSLAVEMGDRFTDEYTKAFNILTLGMVEVRLGDYASAARWFMDALGRAQAAGADIGVIVSLDAIAVLLIESAKDVDLAAMLALVADRMRRDVGGAPTLELIGYGAVLDRLAEHQPDALERASRSVADVTTEQAVAAANAAATAFLVPGRK